MEQRDGHLTHLRVRRRSGPQLEEMPPFPQVGRHHHLSLEAGGQDGTGLLRGAAPVQQVKIGNLRRLTGAFPDGKAMSVQERGADDGDFTAKALLGIVAVAGALLAVGGHAMPDNFMGHTPVTHKLDRDVKVLQDGLMATLDDASHKLDGAGVSDFVLRLIADPPAQLNVLEDGLAIQRGEDFGIGIDDFHVSRSSLVVHADVVQDLSHAKATLVHWAHTIVILLGVGHLHLLETVGAALKMGSKGAEHAAGTAHAGGVKLKIVFPGVVIRWPI